MPRHPADQEQLRKKMPHTRNALREVVSRLAGGGMQRQRIAGAAGWTPAYLSQVLANGDNARVPTPAKLADLIRALYLLSEAQPAAKAEIHRVLGPVAERYGVSSDGQSPADEPIRPTATNYLAREELSWFLESYADRPGLYAIDGAASVGLSTCLAAAAQRLAEGGRHVVTVDCRSLLESPTYRREVPASISRAFIEAIVGTSVPEDPYDAERLLRQALQAYREGVAIVIDNLDSVPLKEGERLNSLLKQWKRYRAEAVPAFANLTVWAAFTSEETRAEARSWLHPDVTFRVSWFDIEELAEVAKVADLYQPYVLARGGGDGWSMQVATAAAGRFGGQPLLTHQFIADRSNDGQPDGEPDVTTHGPYRRHLDRICTLAISLFGPKLAAEVAECMDAPRALPVSVADVVIQRLAICGSPDGTPSNSFYAQYLPAQMKYRLNDLARRSTKSG
jgi:hypothetical protein